MYNPKQHTTAVLTWVRERVTSMLVKQKTRPIPILDFLEFTTEMADNLT